VKRNPVATFAAGFGVAVLAAIVAGLATEPVKALGDWLWVEEPFHRLYAVGFWLFMVSTIVAATLVGTQRGVLARLANAERQAAAYQLRNEGKFEEIREKLRNAYLVHSQLLLEWEALPNLPADRCAEAWEAFVDAVLSGARDTFRQQLVDHGSVMLPDQSDEYLLIARGSWVHQRTQTRA